MSYRERTLRLFLHKARLRQLKNKVIQYYARVFKRAKKKREREEGQGGGKIPGESFSKQTTCSTLCQNIIVTAVVCLTEPADRPPEQIHTWPHATKNYVMNSWVPFGFALLCCKPSAQWQRWGICTRDHRSEPRHPLCNPR